MCLYYSRRISSHPNQNARCPQSRGGGCQVFEGGASQTRQHVETGQEPDRRPQHSEEVGGGKKRGGVDGDKVGIKGGTSLEV